MTLDEYQRALTFRYGIYNTTVPNICIANSVSSKKAVFNV